MGATLRTAVIDSAGKFLEDLIRFLPSFLTALVILALGAVLAAVVKVALHRVFRAVGLDKVSGRLGMVEMLQRWGVSDSLSLLLARVTSWLTFLFFAMVALYALNVPTVEHLLGRFLLYLPNVLVAGLILYLGYYLGAFFGRATLIAAVNAGLGFARPLARLVRLTVVALAGTMALEQMGIGRETVLIAFASIFGGIVLALAIAFGLGGKDLARDYLEGKFKEKERKNDISHV